MTKKTSKQSISFSHTDKVYWPDDGYTKGDLLDYYRSVSTYILPYLKDRPLTLHRFPDGVTQKGFFQKDVKDLIPDWIKTITLPAPSADRDVTYVLCQNKDTLLYLVNLGSIEMNPWHSRTQSLHKPDYLIFDLDPEDVDFKTVVTTAHTLREILDSIGVPAYCKTSGKTGLHIYVPLHAEYTYTHIQHFATAVAVVAHKRLLSITSLERNPHKRKQRVYIDILQNREGQTVVAPYTVRPIPHAPVATPLHWDEVTEKLDPQIFTITSVPKRLQKIGDIFQPVTHDRIDLEKSMRLLQTL